MPNLSHMLAYKRIGLTVKPHLTEKDETVKKVLEIVRGTGADIFRDAQTTDDVSCMRNFPTVSDAGQIDAMLVIGGDGTILRAVRELANFSVPVLSVNRGVVGFLAEVSMDEAHDVLPRLLSGEGVIEERTVLSVQVQRGGETVFRSYALNEAAISQGTIARLLDLRTDINGEGLATFHADGLIVSTPTGSTAYSLAAGGPVVHPHLSALILTPINPHSLTQKPIVIPGSSRVGVDILQTDDTFMTTRVGLTVDGQVYEELHGNDRVTVTTHDQPVRFIRREKGRYFHTLREKLRWGQSL